MTKSQYHKERYFSRRDAGLCPKCGDPATVGTLCLNDWFANVASNHGLPRGSGGKALKQIWESQKGLCAYTGEPLVPGDNASLDHKIPVTQGGMYSLDNVQWVVYQINRMKNDMTEDDFFRACRRVLEQQGYTVYSPAFSLKVA